MSIPFTQYLLPYGRTKTVTIDMPEDVQNKADFLLKSGCHFDIEILTTGFVSMTCERGDDLVSIQICENGPAVVESVRKLIDEATIMLESI